MTPVNPERVIGGEECYRGCDLFRLADPPGGVPSGQPLKDGQFLGPASVQAGVRMVPGATSLNRTPRDDEPLRASLRGEHSTARFLVEAGHELYGARWICSP
jgi:hypothetical protein